MKHLSAFHKKLLRVALAAAVIVLCVFFFRTIDAAKLGQALAGARWQLVALAAAVNFVHLLFKAGRWGVLLSPVGRVGLFSLFRYTLGGYAASNILPARFGEVLRVFYLRPHGIPAAGAAGVQMLEKVYEVVGLMLLLIPVPFVLPLSGDASRAVRVVIGLVVVGGLTAVGIMGWMALHHRIPRQGLLARIGDGIAVLRQPRAALYALVLSIIVWLFDAAEVMLVLAAVGLPHDFFTAILVLLFINFAILAPSTPAQLGVFEAGAVFALRLLGQPQEQAVAFALLYHFMQAIPVTLAGAEALVLWRSLRAKPAAAGVPHAPDAEPSRPG